MTQSHYTLRWNNHQNHILSAFDALLQAETLVDVTLVCAETSVRAHKVVLSACSPFFQRIFSENPCKHPVIVLKDFCGWEVQAIVDFMYKGETSVGQEQLQSLIKAAESLQIRGLGNQEQFAVDKESNSATNHTATPSTSPNDYERPNSSYYRFPTPGVAVRNPNEHTSPYSPLHPNFEPTLKLPHMSQLTFPETLLPRQECQSPMRRRKQARPRRRSGELCSAQDLTTQKTLSSTAEVDVAENLCVKKSKDGENGRRREEKNGREENVGSPEMDLSVKSGGNDYVASPPHHGLPPVLSMKQEIENHSPLQFPPPMPSISALSMTPPHSKFFGLDSHLGLFPPGLDGCRNPLLELTDPRTPPESQHFLKKKSKKKYCMNEPRVPRSTLSKKHKHKLGRPKGQHSAPRGGPPRSWTNAELTEALQHVWNKKMTTSQASRIFGIPYNSLLMYVRGKYGKSLKLEQLRKDCIGGLGMDLVNMSNNNGGNNSCKLDRESSENTRPSSNEAAPPPAVFNPFSPNFYPDFGAAGFPIPVSMIHLLPQSEKNREQYDTQQSEGECKGSVKKEMDEEMQDSFRPSSGSREERREFAHQNGQD